MALLTVQTISQTGIVPTKAAASVSDTFVNNGKTFYSISNGSAGTVTVTVDSLTTCNFGHDHNLTMTVAAGAEKFLGPFEPSRFNSAAGLVTVTLDSATTVTVAAISL